MSGQEDVFSRHYSNHLRRYQILTLIPLLNMISVVIHASDIFFTFYSDVEFNVASFLLFF
jgi:hypothetical protein